MAESVLITGTDLDPQGLREIACDGAEVVIDERAVLAMVDSQELVRRAAASGRPIYGVTTGLGSRVIDAVADGDGAAYSRRTIRGRATAVGEPLPRELTRAAMAVRVNGLCAAGAGASPAVAQALAALLNAGVHPSIPRSGSIGAADLCLMAHVGLGLIGEGEAELDGELMSAAEALSAAGLAPLELGLKDGLAICSSSAVAIGAAALALTDGWACLDAAQVSAALSMEGFRANLTPLDPRVVAARPAPGQRWAADGLRALLRGGELAETDSAQPARRLQDPLSFRCAAPLHGSLHVALELLERAVAPELNGAADNPLVLSSDGEILSTGNFSSPALALALDAVAIACAQVAHGIAERQDRLKETRLSGLHANLVDVAPEGAASRSGVGPLSKTAQALVLEIRHLAAPVSIHASVTADGVEDDSTGAVQAAFRLGAQLARLRSLVALELLVAAQAVDVAAIGRLGEGTAAAHRCIREVVPPLREDRALGAEVMRLERTVLGAGTLLRRTTAAIGRPA
jgi:histidine ammonia-lyase